MTTTLIPLISAIVALVLAIVLTPPVAALARRLGAVDQPSGRRRHRTPTPLLGGLAILGAFLVPVLWFLPFSGTMRALVVGAILMAAVGAADDIIELPPLGKLLAQVAVSLIPVAAGVTIDHVTLPLVGVFDLGWIQYPVSVVWFVALVNMINFTDGVDGLTAGLAMIAALTFTILAASLDRAEASIIAASLAGACAGFLVFNFHPARIFMGDTGSLFVGFLLAGIAIGGVMKSAAAIALVAPLLILALPILDTSFVIAKRLKYRQPVYGADLNHFHHRFANIGWGARKTALVVYAWCALMGAVAVAIRIIPYHSDDSAATLAGRIGLAAIALLAVAATVWLVYRLEILKWRRTPVVTLVRARRPEPPVESSTPPR